MPMNIRALAERRGIAVDQVELLRQDRGLTEAGIQAIPERSLRRALRRMDYPDAPRARKLFRLNQSRDDRGQIPEQALVQALRELDGLRLRSRRQRVAGVPTGGAVNPASLAIVPPPVAGLAPRAWTALGPGNIGGRTRSIVVHPTNHTTIWAGSVGGGVWRTDDAGAGWTPVDDLMANLAVTSLAMDPTDPDVLYAGTGEGFCNIDAMRGGGIFRTTDGHSWNQVPATSSGWTDVNRLAMNADGVTCSRPADRHPAQHRCGSHGLANRPRRGRG